MQESSVIGKNKKINSLHTGENGSGPRQSNIGRRRRFYSKHFSKGLTKSPGAGKRRSFSCLSNTSTGLKENNAWRKEILYTASEKESISAPRSKTLCFSPTFTAPSLAKTGFCAT